MNGNRWVVYTSLTTCPWTKMKTKILKIEIILKNLQISISHQNNALSFITRDTIFSRTENSEAAKCFTLLNPTFPSGTVCVATFPSCFKRFTSAIVLVIHPLCFVYHKYRIIKIFKRTVKTIRRLSLFMTSMSFIQLTMSSTACKVSHKVVQLRTERKKSPKKTVNNKNVHQNKNISLLSEFFLPLVFKFFRKSLILYANSWVEFSKQPVASQIRFKCIVSRPKVYPLFANSMRFPRNNACAGFYD